MADEDPSKPGGASDRRGVPYVPRYAVDPSSVPPQKRVGATKSFRSELRIMKCSDVEAPFCSLEVTKGEKQPAFLEIGVTIDHELCFTFWGTGERVELSLADFTEIYAKALAFLPEAISLSDPVLDAELHLQIRREREPK